MSNLVKKSDIDRDCLYVFKKKEESLHVKFLLFGVTHEFVPISA